jgi:hypothetical protein
VSVVVMMQDRIRTPSMRLAARAAGRAPGPVAIGVACGEGIPSCPPRKAGALCGHERKQTRRSASGTHI